MAILALTYTSPTSLATAIHRGHPLDPKQYLTGEARQMKIRSRYELFIAI